MNITPGTLCLIIGGGPNTGRSCTVLRQVTEYDVQSAIMNAARRVVGIPRPGPYWEIDVSVTWRDRKTKVTLCEAPYIGEKFLLPIPPLADPLQIKREEELKV